MSRNKLTNFSISVFIIISISFLSTFAQDSRNNVFNVNDIAIQNLEMAIRSDNPGLRKSGIYLAGKYAITEASETLIDQLKVETDPDLKILIMRVLYIIEDDKFMNTIHELALTDYNTRVRKMASAIYSAMQIENSLNVADKGN